MKLESNALTPGIRKQVPSTSTARCPSCGDRHWARWCTVATLTVLGKHKAHGESGVEPARGDRNRASAAATGCFKDVSSNVPTTFSHNTGTHAAQIIVKPPHRHLVSRWPGQDPRMNNCVAETPTSPLSCLRQAPCRALRARGDSAQRADGAVTRSTLFPWSPLHGNDRKR